MVSDAVYEHALAERDAALVDLGISRDEYLMECETSGSLRERAEAAEARVAELEQALRLMVKAYELHDQWCGNLASAPGNSIHWQAINAARAALGDPQ